MIAMILGMILGLSGVIQPESFDGWLWAVLIELCFDFPALFIGIRFVVKNADKIRKEQSIDNLPAEKKNRSQDKFIDVSAQSEYCRLCVYDNDEDLPHPTCYKCDGASRFESKYDSAKSNPYSKDTLRYMAWNERHSITCEDC